MHINCQCKSVWLTVICRWIFSTENRYNVGVLHRFCGTAVCICQHTLSLWIWNKGQRPRQNSKSNHTLKRNTQCRWFADWIHNRSAIMHYSLNIHILFINADWCCCCFFSLLVRWNSRQIRCVKTKTKKQID